MSNNRRRGPMGRPGRGMAPGEKAKDLKGTMVKLIKYMRRFYVPIVMVIIFAIASTVFNIVGPTILGDATTEIFKGLVRKVSGGSGINFDKVTHILLMLLSLYVASAIFSFIQGLIMTHVSNNVSYQMRKDISKKIHRMPMKYFESRTYGEVLSRVTNDVDNIRTELKPEYDTDHHISDTDRRCIYYDDTYQYSDDDRSFIDTSIIYGIDRFDHVKISAIFQGTAETPWRIKWSSRRNI